MFFFSKSKTLSASGLPTATVSITNLTGPRRQLWEHSEVNWDGKPRPMRTSTHLPLGVVGGVINLLPRYHSSLQPTSLQAVSYNKPFQVALAWYFIAAKRKVTNKPIFSYSYSIIPKQQQQNIYYLPWLIKYYMYNGPWQSCLLHR